MFHRPALAAALALLAAHPALGQSVDARAARPLLFPADRVEVVRVDLSGLSAEEVQVLGTVAQSQRYYAAVAFAPDAGIMAEPTVLAANYHSPEAARAAAVSGCNGRRQGGRDCVIALEVRPLGWQPRGLSLSADATQAFDDDYRSSGGRRALAVSAASGQWGIGRGRNAADEAIATCRGESQVSDCAVVIAD